MGGLPSELIYSIIDVLAAEEAGWHDAAYGERFIMAGVCKNLLPCMLVSRNLYSYLAPVVFRHIHCHSADRIRGFHQRLIENPTLATHVHSLTVETSQLSRTEEPWMRDELSLIEVLRTLAPHSLESLSFIIIESLGRLRWNLLPVALKTVLHQLVGRHGTIKHLCLWNVELSERLVDELSDSLDSLEFGGVTMVANRPRSTPQPNIKPLKIRTLATWGSFGAFHRLCGPELDDRRSNGPAFPKLKKIILPSPYISIESVRIEWIKTNAPNLDTIRFPLRPGQYEEHFNIDRLSAKGPFRHVELYHEIETSPCFIPPTTTLQYLAQVSEPSNLETLTIIITIPGPVRGVRSCTLPSLEEPVRVNDGMAEGSLLQILEDPFYCKLRRVTLDFRNVVWHHPQLNSQFEPQIRRQFPEGLHAGRFEVRLRF